MKKEDLKVGQSFDVVEVLDNLGFGHLKGRQGIVTELHGYDGFEFKEFNPLYTTDPYLYRSEFKNIAKLTITKLK